MEKKALIVMIVIVILLVVGVVSFLSIGENKEILKIWDNITYSDIEVPLFNNAVELSACAEINTPGAYVLTGDIIDHGLDDTCFKINSPDVALSCGGYTVRGDNLAHAVYSEQDKTTIVNCRFIGGWTKSREGIYLEENKDNKIVNVDIINFSKGLYLNRSLDNQIENLFSEGNVNEGMVLDHSEGNQIINATFLRNDRAIQMLKSNNNLLKSIIILPQWRGDIIYYSSEGNVFEQIIIIDSHHGLTGMGGKNNLFKDSVFKDTSSAMVLYSEGGSQFSNITVEGTYGGALDSGGFNFYNSKNILLDDILIKDRKEAIKGRCSNCEYNNVVEENIG